MLARYPIKNGKEILLEEPLKIPAYPAWQISSAGAGGATPVITYLRRSREFTRVHPRRWGPPNGDSDCIGVKNLFFC